MTDLFDKTPLSELPTNTLDHRLPTDLEDFGASQSHRAKISQVKKMGQKRKTPDTEPVAVADPCASLPGVIPSPTEDYAGFL